MKYALISDMHGNLPALETVLEDIDRRNEVDAIYHLGDLVGYAPWPNEVVALVKEWGITGIAGNYDSTTATDYPHCGCKADSPAVRNCPTTPTSGPGSTSPLKPRGSSGHCPSGWT
jgi:predicted phosphodiesterase